MVSIGLFPNDSEALQTYGLLRAYAEQAGIEDPRSMGSLSLGAQNAVEGHDNPSASNAYRFHLPIPVFERMRQAAPELFQTSPISTSLGSPRAQ